MLQKARSTSESVGKARRLHEAIRFAFPQRYAILSIIALTVFIAALNAVEPLVLKALFDELAGGRSVKILVLGLLLLVLFAIGREAMVEGL